MNWPPTHSKSHPLELDYDDFLSERGVTDADTNVTFLYTDRGYQRDGDWSTTGNPWQKGTCIVEFMRVCEDGKDFLDLEAGGGESVTANNLRSVLPATNHVRRQESLPPKQLVPIDRIVRRSRHPRVFQ